VTSVITYCGWISGFMGSLSTVVAGSPLRGA
jgi:hypothetical protein